MNKIINLTPHSVKLIKENNETISIKSSGIIRVSESVKTIGSVNGIKLIKKTLSDIPREAINQIKEHLKNDDYVLVSLMTARKLKEMKVLTDEELSKVLVIGHTIRNSDGVVVGSDSLTTAKQL